MYVCAECTTTAAEFIMPDLPQQKRRRGNPQSKKKIVYKDIVCAFDIETSVIKWHDEQHAIMYHWQFQFGLDVTVCGRSWNDYFVLLDKMRELLEDGEYIVIYVHNLSYEFQFLRGWYSFGRDEVFCLKARKILKCDMFNHFEYRCSYLHSNMSLAVYTQKMGVVHYKEDSEDYNHTKTRYPYTPLTAKELRYCYNDVRGLVEAVMTEMEVDGDNLYTIPLTSTGYVRRDTKRAVRTERRELAKQIYPDIKVYQLLREAFRGGNCHANRYYAGVTLPDVKSADRSSSYPDVLCNCKFPVTQFYYEEDCDIERLERLRLIRGKALLFRVALSDVELIDELFGAPYLARDKCRHIVGAEYDNGRILSAKYIETTVTDVDWKIITSEYKFSTVEVWDVYSARYGYLPRPIIKTNINYYRLKTELKDVEGKEILYTKSKNKLNSIYGMMAQNPVKEEIAFENGDYVEQLIDKEEKLTESARKAFLAYQWGVWCTAWARYRLEEGIRLAGHGFVYADTDSVKYVGTVDYAAYNKQRIADSKASGAYATDPHGVVHYMGVYEADGEYSKFRTLGAKKYAYIPAHGKKAGRVVVTVSGVVKAKGGAELEKRGGIDAFAPDFVFREAGGTDIVYNDHVDITVTLPNGESLRVRDNAVIKDSTYKLGISGDYEYLLQHYLDFDRFALYNDDVASAT